MELEGLKRCFRKLIGLEEVKLLFNNRRHAFILYTDESPGHFDLLTPISSIQHMQLLPSDLLHSLAFEDWVADNATDLHLYDSISCK